MECIYFNNKCLNNWTIIVMKAVSMTINGFQLNWGKNGPSNQGLIQKLFLHQYFIEEVHQSFYRSLPSLKRLSLKALFRRLLWLLKRVIQMHQTETEILLFYDIFFIILFHTHFHKWLMNQKVSCKWVFNLKCVIIFLSFLLTIWHMVWLIWYRK